MPPVGEGTATLPFSHGSVSAVNRTGAPCSPSSSVATSSTTARPPTATQVPPGSLHKGGTSLPVGGAGSSSPLAAAAMAPNGSLSQRTSPLSAGFGVCSPPGTGAPAAPGNADTPACMPAIRSPRGPPLRAIIVSAASTMPGFRSVESCTSAGPCGAGGTLHAPSSAAATATLRSNFMGAQPRPPGALATGEQPSVAGQRLDRRIAQFLQHPPAL